MHFGSYLVHRRTVGSAHFLRQIVGSVFHLLGDMGDQDIALDDVDWSEDSNVGECDPGAPLTVQASSNRNPDHTHMRTLHISSKCRSSRMIRRTVGNSTMGWISALGIPTFTSVLLLQNHMKLLRILANRTGAFCSALFLPE